MLGIVQKSPRAILLFLALFLSGCGSSNSYTTLKDSSDYISLWASLTKICAPNPWSDECDELARNPILIQQFWSNLNFESGNLPLSIDFYDADVDSEGDYLSGNMFCHKMTSLCTSSLEIENLQNQPWEKTLKFKLTGEKNVYSSDTNMYFSKPLNPGIRATFEAAFEVPSREFENLTAIHIYEEYSGRRWSIPLCALEKPDEYGNLYYFNFIRVHKGSDSGAGCSGFSY